MKTLRRTYFLFFFTVKVTKTKYGIGIRHINIKHPWCFNLFYIGLGFILYVFKKPNNFNLGRLIIFSSIMKIIIYIFTLCNISFIGIYFVIVLAIFSGLYKAKNKLDYFYNTFYMLLVIFTFWHCFYSVFDIVSLLSFSVFFGEYNTPLKYDYKTPQVIYIENNIFSLKYDYLEEMINKMLVKLNNYNIPSPGGGPGPNFDPIIFHNMLDKYDKYFDPESGSYDFIYGINFKNYKDFIVVDGEIYSTSDLSNHLEKINRTLDIPSKSELTAFKDDYFALHISHWRRVGWLPNGNVGENIDSLKASIGWNLGLFRQELNVLHKGYLYYLGYKSPENQLCYEFWQKRQLIDCTYTVANSFEKAKIDTDWPLQFTGWLKQFKDFTKTDIFNLELVENLLYILLLLDLNSTLAEFISKNPDIISKYNNDSSGLEQLYCLKIIDVIDKWYLEPKCRAITDEWLKLTRENGVSEYYTRWALYEAIAEANPSTGYDSHFILSIIDKIKSSPEEHYTSPVKTKFVEHYTGKPINTWKFTDYTGPKLPINISQLTKGGFHIENHEILGKKPFPGMETHLTEIAKSRVCKSLELSSKDIVKYTGPKPSIDTSQLIKGFHIIDHNILGLGNKPFPGMKSFLSR